jgi:hypothetical protein
MISRFKDQLVHCFISLAKIHMWDMIWLTVAKKFNREVRMLPSDRLSSFGLGKIFPNVVSQFHSLSCMSLVVL